MMEFKNIIVRVFVFLLGCSLSSGRSLRSKVHNVAKRQAYPWDVMCPPMDFKTQFNPHSRCSDSCVTDDYCTRGQICCPTLNGCRMCLDPVPPPPVVDWPSGGHRGYTDRHTEGEDKNMIFLKEPHYEELVCYMDGQTYSQGVFYKGCRKCVCNEGGYVACEVHCRKDKNVRPIDEEESGSGDKDEETSGEQPVKKEYPNEIFPLSFGDESAEKQAGPKLRFSEVKQPTQERLKLPVEGFKESDLESPPSGYVERKSDDYRQARRKIGEDFLQRIKHKQNRNSYKITAQDVVNFDDLGDVFLA